jgi:Zn-dependent M28 family amino/carboxypeptidase
MPRCQAANHVTSGRRLRLVSIGLAIAVGGCASVAPTAVPGPPTPVALQPAASPRATGSAPDAAVVAAAITEEGLRSRLDALAAVSTAATGYRAVGTAGFDAAADLVASSLEASGWQVSRFGFSMPAFVDPGDSRLVVDGRTFAARDILPLIYAPPGDVSGRVVAIDRPDEATPVPGKGCTAADYPEWSAGAIVVVRSGPCFRRDQVLAAQSVGAAGFVAAYPRAEGGSALRPTLIDPADLRIPAVGASLPVAQALVAAAGSGMSAQLVTDASAANAPTRSIIAELPGSDPDRVVMLGAHLDSVVDGPGINDNGSGVAALLELADALGGSRPGATIRIALWSGEELGLRGSSEWVGSRSSEELGAIVAYLNADMLASPNGIAGVYDESIAADGSAAIRDLIAASITRQGGSPEPMDVSGQSDHFPFIQAGVPTGGVFSGADERISVAQASASDARAGQAADPCYHQPCDDGSSVNLTLGRLLAATLAEVAVQVSNGDPSAQ